MLRLWKSAARQPRRSVTRRYAKPMLEGLEDRVVPYSTGGNSWVVPQLITISFVPDGTILGYNGSGQAIRSTLFHDFAYLGSSPSVWENQILKAAQVWAQQTNVNFSVVSDNGADIGSGNYEQGDPGFGDIRIGGTQMGTSNEPLALAYLPPQANNYSIAGDITFNTSEPYNIGSTYDLFTVAAHEFGHALGLGESSTVSAVMYSSYTGVASGLSSDDIAGIRSLYSNGNVRSFDSYNNSISSFSTAASITVNGSTDTDLVTGLDITRTTEVEMFKFTAPNNSAGTMTVTVQSAGLSLLSPKLYVYNASQQQIGYVNGVNQYGTTLTVTVNITPGSIYYVKVEGADSTAFSTGAYGLVIDTGTGAAPSVPTVNNRVANGSTLQSSSGQALQPGGGYTYGGQAGFELWQTHLAYAIQELAESLAGGLGGLLSGLLDVPQVLLGGGLGDPKEANGDGDDDSDPDADADPLPALPINLGRLVAAVEAGATFPMPFATIQGRGPTVIGTGPAMAAPFGDPFAGQPMSHFPDGAGAEESVFEDLSWEFLRGAEDVDLTAW